MNWKLTLSYDGSTYHGWQVQPTLPTIQGTLAAVLHHLTGETVLPQGSGRTDAGVHALAQVTTFQLEAAIPAENLLRALNRALPPSIRVLSAEPVPATFHARHSALAKTYEYRIFPRRHLNDTTDRICSPFLAPYVWDCHWPLDLTPMQTAATHLLGTHNFTSFAAADPDLTQRTKTIPDEPQIRVPYPFAPLQKGGVSSEARPLPPMSAATTEPTSAPNPTKTITQSTFTLEDDLLIYRITGSGFLHHMVRNIVGTLTEIGRGALSPNDIPLILAARNRTAAGPTAPASGLFLHTVHYDSLLPIPYSLLPAL